MHETVALSPEAISEAARRLRGGGLVAFPTETVYGLGANACDGKAVARIFEAKGRPRFNPLIVHVESAEAGAALADFNPDAQRLAEAFWPGPLTLVLPRKAQARLSDLVSAGLPTVALRVPGHDPALALLRAAGVPVAAPSANLSGKVSATRAGHVAEDFGGRVDMILDGGAAIAGIESTIVAVTEGEPRLLRAGATSAEDIARILGRDLKRTGTGIEAPGMMASHYAPRAHLRLDAERAHPGEAFLTFGPSRRCDGPKRDLSLSGDLREAAANLFAHLRALDSSGVSAIAVMPIPRGGLGDAINDRLRRAAAPRDAELAHEL